jgi:hypothetical protein
MNLKSFGCSFVFGSELPDEAATSTQLAAAYSKLTWPAHLANYLDYNYQCYARPGSGNLQIAERVLSQAVGVEKNLYVIGWSWIDRFDYINPEMTEYHPSKFWRTLMPIDDNSTATNYYKNLHSECRDKLITLINMKVVIDTLKQKEIPFIMTYMDELVFDTQWHVTPAIVELQNYVKPYMTKFDGLTFLDWSRKNNYPETDMWHPLEQAHQAGAEYLIKSKVLSISEN